MKTMLSRRILSLLLCVLMCASLFPAGAFAEDWGSVDFSDAVEVTEPGEEAADLGEETALATESEEADVISNEPSAAQATTDHYLAFATDRHATSSAIGTAMSTFDSSVEYVNLIGDMVNNEDSYSASTMVNEVKALFSGATVQILKGNHDDGATDDVGGVVIDSTGVLYTGPDSDGNGSPDYYVYGIKYADMDDEPASSTVAGFKDWVDGIDTSIPVIVVCHMPMHQKRGDNAGGYTWAKALNYAATGSETGTEIIRDVVFLHGHNHTDDTNEYYYVPGDNVAMQSGSSGSASVTIEFSYMTAGYLKANKHATQVTITDTTITFNRSGTELGTVTRVSGGSGTYKVRLDKTDATMLAGDTVTLSATVTAPEGADIPSVSWSSSNADVATVDNGTVTALTAGTAMVTASITYMEDGVENTKTAGCEVTVHAYGEPTWTWTPAASAQEVTTNVLPASSSSNQINQTLTVNANDTVAVYARYYTSQPSSSSKTFSVTSSDSSVAEVSTGSLAMPGTSTKNYVASEANGDVCFTIKAKAEGTATITLSYTSSSGSGSGSGGPGSSGSGGSARTYTATVTLTVGPAMKGEGYTATASFACAGCEDVQTVEAEVTSVTTVGKITYTAAADFNGKTYTDTKVVNLYIVTCNSAENGSVTSDADEAGVVEGTEITLTVTPAEGYDPDTLSVMDESGAEVTVDGNKFTMPAGNVTVTVAFKLHVHAKGTEHAAVAATCTEAGTVEYWDCTGCDAMLDADGNVLEDITAPALGHDYVTTTTEATCTKAGSTITKCTRCGDISSEVEIPALGHNYASVRTEATCTVDGKIVYTCSRCDDSYTETIPATGHKYESVTTEATCTEDGKIVYTCANCGGSYTETIPATGHSYKSVRTEATCTAAGSIVYTCTNCSDSYTTVIPALGHDYQVSSTTPATCGTDGKTVYTCTRCEDSYTEAIAKTGDHKYVGKVTKEATCAAEGIMTYTCSVCGDSYTEAIAKTTNHQYVGKVTKEPTCAVEGVKTYTCSVCGDSYSELIAKTTDHSYVSEVTVEPTCTTEGVMTYTCSICGTSYTEAIEKVAHNYETTVIEPTCTETGVTITACTVCGDESSREVIPALGHDYQATSTRAATCTEAGYTVYTCSRCDDSYTETIPATGHNYTSVRTEPTCTAKGSIVYTCENCGDTYSEEIPMTAHDYVTTVIEPTCITEGATVHTCSVCGNSYSEPIAKIDHNYETTTVEPTCTEAGVTITACTVCGEESSREVIPALGHVYQVTSTRAATCTKAGYTVYTCSRCGDSYTETIPATGHKYESVTTEATCTEAGSIVYTCTNCSDSYTTVIQALGHDYQVSSTTPATCGTDGKTVYTCTRCKDSYTEAIARTGDHKYVGKVTKEATCAAEGIMTYTCSVCGDSYTEAIAKTTNHQYVGKVTKEPTCAVEGVKTYTCSVCGDSYTEEIAKTTDHQYVGAVTTEPTCIAEGVMTYTCKVCGTSYTESIAKVDHNYETTTVEPTCTEAGVTITACTVCGEESSREVIPALGHVYQVTSTRAATCTEAGYTVYTCSRCDDSYTETIPATGHNYTSVRTEPTCTAKGSIVYTCENCGDTYSEEIPMTAHNYVTTVIEPTCTTEGATVHTCSVCGNSYSEPIAKIDHKYETTTVEPTCTEEGVTVYTCTVCGYSYTDTIAALGHDYVKTENKGDITYTCSRCGDEYEELLPRVNIALKVGETSAAITMEGEQSITYSGDESVASAVLTVDEDKTTSTLSFTGLKSGETYYVVDGTRYVITVTAITGDFDANGTVNLKDLLVLKKYLAGEKVTIDISADMNDDQTVNLKDLLALKNMLANS